MNLFLSALTFLIPITFGMVSGEGSLTELFSRGFPSESRTTPGVGTPSQDAAEQLPEEQQTAETIAQVERQEAPRATSTEKPKPSTTPAEIAYAKLTQQAPTFVAVLESIAHAGEQIKGALFEEGDGLLSVSEILQLTNAERQSRGLSPLSYNRTLAQMAQIKASDIIAQDYFDHVSPQGVGVGELANQTGYGYILVGENLALGDFRDNEHVVDSWMESPGHRANLMHDKFTEIGIAVLKGEFDGKQTWVAVQEFGLPRTVCPFPDQLLKTSIDTASGQLALMQQEIATLRAQFQSMQPGGSAYDSAYTTLNALITDYNTLVAQQKTDVANYNASVKSYNTCIASNS